MTEPKSTVVKIHGIDVDYFLTEEDHDKMLAVDPNQLDQMWKDNPATAAFIGHLYGRAIAQQARLKVRRDQAEAMIGDELRAKAVEAGDKVVEAKIEKEVRKDKRFVAIAMAYAEAQGVAITLEGVHLAARARQQSLRHFSDKAAHEASMRGSYKPRGQASE